MEPTHAALYGIVEGITEFLPISSTGHLMLLRHFLDIAGTDFVKSFEIIIQLGAILAVVVLYPKRFFADREALLRIAAALIPTLILGAAAYPFVKLLQGDNMIVLVPATLVVGGFVLLFFERFVQPQEGRGISNMPIRTAAAIGVFQAISFVPGVSRAGATIVSAMALGMKKEDAIEFSFLLAAPTMLAATSLDLIKHSDTFSNSDLFALGIGFTTSFVVAVAAIRFLVRFIANHSFALFGVYRILIGTLLFVLFAL